VRKCDDSTRAEEQVYYGDTLDVLRQYIADEPVDVIYLDLHFNSNRDYSVIFSEGKVTCEQSQAQIHAFEDTWHWTYLTR
jgi:adenine specific DNA methylase Mod